MTKGKKQRSHIVAGVILFLANIMFFLTIWLPKQYDQIFIDQFLFQLKSTDNGAYRALGGGLAIEVGLFSVLATAAEILLYKLLAGKLRDKLQKFPRYIAYCDTGMCKFFREKRTALAVIMLIVNCIIFFVRMGVPEFVGAVAVNSDFIEAHYVDPEEVSLKFPEEKRNLIYIFLESMENAYADKASGGVFESNYIPELTELAEENINFSHSDKMGGAFSFSGTTWTASAMAAHTCGMPVKVDLTADAYGAGDQFLPGVVALGDVLEDAGYQQTLLLGSNAEFHGRESYFRQHGNYTIVDTETLKAEGKLPEDYQQWWGFEDEKLFAYAKLELKRLAAEGKPFNFTMLTADSHFPGGYKCRLCEDIYEEQYANVLTCSSGQVTRFIEWIKEQPFYENTTIVLCGDHLTMDAGFMEDVDENYVRTTYNCIINAPVLPVQEKNRAFGTFDMFPTTLGALGVVIEGGRLALGTDLFSGEKTLTELYGYEVLEEELLKSSDFYRDRFLGER